MADTSDKMQDMKDKAATKSPEMNNDMQERMEQKMHNDDRERSANEE